MLNGKYREKVREKEREEVYRRETEWKREGRREIDKRMSLC